MYVRYVQECRGVVPTELACSRLGSYWSAGDGYGGGGGGHLLRRMERVSYLGRTKLKLSNERRKEV